MSDAANRSHAEIAASAEASLERLWSGIGASALDALVDGEAVDQAELDRLYDQGREALAQERLDEALDAFASLAVRAPGKPEYQFGYALCLQHFGQVKEAGRHFAASLALDPSDAACAYRLGECLAGCGYLDDARDALNAALALCRLPDCDPGIAPLAESLLDRLA